MEYSIGESADLESLLDRILITASRGLNRAADELRADTVAVLVGIGGQAQISYFWSRAGERTPFPESVINLEECGNMISRAVSAASPLGTVLRNAISPRAASFLLYPMRLQQESITIVFCFAAKPPVAPQIPESVIQSLDLIGAATWAFREIGRLRTEIGNVSKRLAGRKVVERAKGVLQFELGITEERAYEVLRNQSRRRRIAMTSVAEELLQCRALTGQLNVSA